MENDLPKIDIPQDVIAGEIRDGEILKLYRNFPCRLKAEILVLCKSGNLEASINLTHYRIGPNDFITLLPGTILQIHQIEGSIEVYFLGLSASFMETVTHTKPLMDICYAIRQHPVLPLHPDIASLFEEYFKILVKIYTGYTIKNQEFSRHTLCALLYGLGEIYHTRHSEDTPAGKSEKLTADFIQLVMEFYTKERNVSFYAAKLGITPAHLSTTVRQVTGKTCIDIISSMVIMDAKAQLKSTDSPIHQIAYSLSFTNMSFFGKYFKRYVGMGPQEYRNS